MALVSTDGCCCPAINTGDPKTAEHAGYQDAPSRDRNRMRIDRFPQTVDGDAIEFVILPVCPRVGRYGDAAQERWRTLTRAATRRSDAPSLRGGRAGIRPLSRVFRRRLRGRF